MLDRMAPDDTTARSARTTQILTAFAAAIDSREWGALAALLAPTFGARFVHTGEAFDRDGFVSMNRDYPLVVRFEPDEIVVAGARGVVRATVSDTASQSVWHVASFATVDEHGLVTDLVEVWADGTSSVPDDRR